MAATIKVPASRPAGRQHRQLLALITVGVAPVPAVTAALILIAVARGLAPALRDRIYRALHQGTEHQ